MYLPPPRPRKGRAVYGGLIFLMVLGGFLLQSRWMQGVRERKDSNLVPQGMADKIGRWMLEKRGMDPNVLRAGDPGVERIDCETCLGTGEIFGEAGGRSICPICQGVGFRMIRRFDAAEKICPNCAGMGRTESLETGEVGVCPRCGGRGLVRSPPAPADWN